MQVLIDSREVKKKIKSEKAQKPSSDSNERRDYLDEAGIDSREVKKTMKNEKAQKPSSDSTERRDYLDEAVEEVRNDRPKTKELAKREVLAVAIDKFRQFYTKEISDNLSGGGNYRSNHHIDPLYKEAKRSGVLSARECALLEPLLKDPQIRIEFVSTKAEHYQREFIERGNFTQNSLASPKQKNSADPEREFRKFIKDPKSGFNNEEREIFAQSSAKVKPSDLDKDWAKLLKFPDFPW